MDFLNQIKALYGNTNEKIVVVDKNLQVLWKNSDDLPDFMIPNDFKKLKSQDVQKSVILRYVDDYAIKAMPLYDENELEGYMITFFDPDEIETLYDRSVHLKYKKNSLGNQKIALMPIVNTLDECKTKGKELPSDFCEEAKILVLKLLSATVNYQELSKYYSDDIFTELLNVSLCLEETAQLFESRFCDNCEFTYNIQAGIFLNINYNCLQNAVLNLLVNGYMYNNKADKKLKLSVFSRGNNVLIEIWDNGEDADCTVLDKSMVPFRGLDSFAQKEALGLAVVEKFAEYFGGKLSYEKCDGLTMRITLDYYLKEKPTSFRLKRQLMTVGEFEPASCLIAKALYK